MSQPVNAEVQRLTHHRSAIRRLRQTPTATSTKPQAAHRWQRMTRTTSIDDAEADLATSTPCAAAV
ncbi:hypothetical protein IU459_35375 [Nocardia amamiensis]|uniref:Uncharacterized protein n=1 Tax=Nocardia amamiensis TaxID=404578 RepID=A0ABS0D460_9NOCA|nr:hypothetical protein [Nocardia amamiensis]MBF6302777.1 hypothetical protein [Nocardia amamiensis]